MSDNMPVLANTTLTENTAASSRSATGQGISLSAMDGATADGSFPALFDAQLEAAGASSSQFPLELLQVDPIQAELTTEGGNILPTETAMLGTPLMIPALENSATGLDAPSLSALNSEAALKAQSAVPLAVQAELGNKPLTGLTGDSTGLTKTPVIQTPGLHGQQATQLKQEQLQLSGLNGQSGLNPEVNQDKQLLMQMANREQTTPLLESTRFEPVTQTNSAQPLSQAPQGLSAMAGLAGMTTSMGRSEMVAAPITVPPQHPGWNNAVGERIQWMVGNNLQQADIRLDPPELGSLEVRIHVNKDQANIMFSAPNQQVRDVLESALPRLREMMGDMGLSLGDVGVSQESFKESRESAEQSGVNNSSGNNDELEQDNIMTGNNVMVKGTSSGLLDTYA